MIEQWAVLEEHPLWSISSDGRVWHAPCNERKWGTCLGGIMPDNPVGLGYRRIRVGHGLEAPARTIHFLVARAFLGPRPPGMQIRHLDGNPANNTLVNLAYGTPKENQADRVSHGTDSRGSKCATAKLTEEQVHEIRRRLARGDVQRRIAEDYGVDFTTVHLIHKRRSWAWLETPPLAPRKQVRT